MVDQSQDLDIFITPTAEISHSVESASCAAQPDASITSQQQMEEENPRDFENDHLHHNTQLHDENQISHDPAYPLQQSAADLVEFEKFGIKFSVNDELELSQPYPELPTASTPTGKWSHRKFAYLFTESCI